MTVMLDLAPASGEMARLIRGITDDQLSNRTPCPDYTLADLVDHVDGLALAFTWAATKDPAIADSQAPAPDGSRLSSSWRDRIGDGLEELALAWKDPGAWQGMTRAGGVDLPGDVAGLVAVNELVIHGWDVAVGSGQAYQGDPAAVQASLAFLTASAAPDEKEARDSIFGPIVPVPADAPALEQALGLSGRDPRWSAA
jgi:uncharacterized protein (TIGR03086 family)